jgi:hypothetical protein
MKAEVCQHRIHRVERLAQRHPGRWCWVDLYLAALCGREDGEAEPGWLRNAEAQARACQAESRQMGACDCGGFRDGIWQDGEPWGTVWEARD